MSGSSAASGFDPLLAFAPLFAATWPLLRLAAVTVSAGKAGLAAPSDRPESVRTLSGATLRNASRTRAAGPPKSGDEEEMKNA